MKKILIIIVLSFLFTTVNEAKVRTLFTANFGYFYNTLSPHGDWYEIENGIYVWKPYGISDNWQPYSIGSWVWTSDGWYWDSYEHFGNVTYHYGRWFYDDYFGWVWYPGYEWAPAWVEWRYDNDYIGWAPLPPYALFQYNSGIVFTMSWNAPLHYWYFVRYNHFCNGNVYNHGISHNYKKVLFRNTKTRNNYTYTKERIINNGLNRDFIESKVGRSVVERKIVDTDKYENRNNGNDVVRFKPNDKEVQKFSGVERYDAKNSIGRTSLKLDKVVDNNYKIDRNNTGETINKSRIEVKRNNTDNTRTKINSNKTDSEIQRVNKDIDRNNNFNTFENRKNIESNERKNVIERNTTTNRVKEYKSNETRTKTQETKTNVKKDTEVKRNVERKTR